jgi:hypothetical protein
MEPESRKAGRNDARTFAIAATIGAAVHLILAGASWAGAGENQQDWVDLELVLAVDVSDSMTRSELQLQRQGYALALRHPDFVNAIGWGAYRRIAVSLLEWSGPDSQHVIVPWSIIGDRASAEGFSARVARAPIVTGSGTSISGALAASGHLFEQSPFLSLRQVVDISGDGPNNAGRPVVGVRDWLIGKGVSINGLPIVLDTKSDGRFMHYGREYLSAYFDNCVIGGSGAFVAEAASADTFGEAVRRKLVLEIAGGVSQLQIASTSTNNSLFDCASIGEIPGR